MKWRNSKERELLSSGSSRDVTLPSKGNPNPDLSDVQSEKRVAAPDTTDTRFDGDLSLAKPPSDSSASVCSSEHQCLFGDIHSDDDMAGVDSGDNDDEDIDVS